MHRSYWCLRPRPITRKCPCKGTGKRGITATGAGSTGVIHGFRAARRQRLLLYRDPLKCLLRRNHHLHRESSVSRPTPCFHSVVGMLATYVRLVSEISHKLQLSFVP